MTKLSPFARQTLKDAGISQAAYARWLWIEPAGWHGDECGCSDDRCIGYHHDEGEECGCLLAQIEKYHEEQTAARDAATLWADHLVAVESGKSEDREAVDEALQAWATKYHPRFTSVSLDRIVDGQSGITTTNPYNDQVWLNWSPAQS